MNEPSTPAAFGASAPALPLKTLFVRLRHGEPDVIGRYVCCVCGAPDVEHFDSILVGNLSNRRYVRAGMCPDCWSRRARAARRRAFALGALVSAACTLAWLALALAGEPNPTAPSVVPAVVVAIVVAGGPFVAATPAFPGARWRTDGGDVVIELPTQAVLGLAPEIMPHLPPHQALHVARMLVAVRA